MDDDRLAELLSRRPDLAEPPPADFETLAERAAWPGSLERCMGGLDRFATQLLEALCLLPDGADMAALAELLGVPGACFPAEVEDGLRRLAGLALVGPGPAGRLALAGRLRQGVRYPAPLARRRSGRPFPRGAVRRRPQPRRPLRQWSLDGARLPGPGGRRVLRRRQRCVVLPCGAGKTIVGAAALARASATTLVLATNTVAARQWRRELLAPTTLSENDIGEYSGQRKEIRPAVAIQVSGTFGSRQEEAQRLGRILRPKAGGGQAAFYTVVARDTNDADFAAHRQRFLAEQGYAYEICDAEAVLAGER